MKRRFFVFFFIAIVILLAGSLGFWFGFKNPGKTNLSIFSIKNEVGKNKELAAVVPHHDLVKKYRTDFLEELSKKSQPKTLILVSTNHFNAGTGNIITSKRGWVVTNGEKILSANAALVDDLLLNGLATDDQSAFDNEHGIKNLLSEISLFFPESKLIPLIIKDTSSPETIKKLSDFLLANCSDCGVIASVDMSHYQPAHVAEIHDLKTLRALRDLNDEEVWQTEVDSSAALALLINWVKTKELNNFILSGHTNSGLLANSLDSETTTHIFGYYDRGLPLPKEDSITFTFAGDAMFGREIGYQFQKNNFQDLFANLGNRTFWGTDISWLNLEGPVSDKTIPQPRQIPSLKFNFSQETLAALKYLKIITVGLANNHTLNQNFSGLSLTENLLKKSGIDWVGHPNEINDTSIARREQDGIKISLIAINPTFGITNIEDIIKQEKNNGNFVIVLPHWGNEYEQSHSASQEKLAQDWFSAGADIIIGSHPHVIQDAQIIDGKLVLYSLGNFIFDQYFSQETKQGLVIAGKITKDRINIVLLPIISNNLKPEILKGNQKNTILEKVCQNIKEYCRYDVIELNR